MDPIVVQRLLAETEVLLHRGEQDLAHQRDAVRAMRLEGRDVTEAALRLRRLEVRQARHIGDRNRLFTQLGDKA